MKRAAAVLGTFLALALVAPPVTGMTSGERVARKRLYNLINGLRATTGDGVLTPDAGIEAQSRRHSRYMARTKDFGHTGVAARAAAVETDPGTTFRCENVAFVKGANYTARSAARRLFKLWKNSPGHYQCMTDAFGVANVAGIGVKQKGTSWYATFIAAYDTSP